VVKRRRRVQSTWAAATIALTKTGTLLEVVENASGPYGVVTVEMVAVDRTDHFGFAIRLEEWTCTASLTPSDHRRVDRPEAGAVGRVLAGRFVNQALHYDCRQAETAALSPAERRAPLMILIGACAMRPLARRLTPGAI
jgi:hypothetical protein